MTPDEAMLLSHERGAIGRVHAECGTCEDEGAVAWCKRPIRTEESPARDLIVRLCQMGWGDTLRVGDRASDARPWGIDFCPECGRGREVGKL